MRRTVPALVVLVVLGSTSALRAQPRVQVTVRDGRVSVKANDATLPEILTEWAAVGQTRIVNAEKISAPPVTIELIDVPEREALSVLLRPVSGYMAVARTPASENLSHFARILIFPGRVTAPSSSQALPPPVFAPPTLPPPAVTRILDAAGQPVPDDQDGQPPPPSPGAPTPSPMSTPTAKPAPAPVGTAAPGVIVPPPQTDPAAGTRPVPVQQP